MSNAREPGRIMTEYKIIEVSEKPYLYVDRQCPMQPSVISRTMGEAFKDVMGFVESQGITPDGPLLSIYYSYDPDTVAFRAGVFVTAEDARTAQGDIKAGTTPAGRVLSFTHTGPYSTLSESYSAMMGWLTTQGLKFGAPTWEAYVDDPDSTPEAELRTDIFVSLA